MPTDREMEQARDACDDCGVTYPDPCREHLPPEHALVQQWCRDHNIDLGGGYDVSLAQAADLVDRARTARDAEWRAAVEGLRKGHDFYNLPDAQWALQALLDEMAR